MTSTRKLILDYLQIKPFATAAELSHALKMTTANVRHHVNVLMEEGAVEVIAQQPPQGRGRPAHLYNLTQQAHRHNLDGLASAMLKTYLSNKAPEYQSASLKQIAKNMASTANLKPATSLPQRLFQAVHRLNEMGYQTRWEAHSEAPHLILGHCPYAAILPEHPELCQLDSYLIEELLGVPASQAKKLAQDLRGARYCLFIVGKSK